MPQHTFTAILEREEDSFVSHCPELDIASQGATVEEALSNLKIAVELFLECADAAEVRARLKEPALVTRFQTTFHA